MNIPFITTKEAAQTLKISEQYIRTLLREDKLEGQQLGKAWFISPRSVIRYKNQQKRQNPPDKPNTQSYKNEIKALSFFSGAMGLDLGLEKAGIKLSLACESDKFCRQTILRNRPDIALIGDITTCTPEQILDYAGIKAGNIDIFVGGPPCQTFSTAGSRRGFNDKRGNLLLAYIDLILKLRPQYAVIENVRGLLSAPLNHRPHAQRGEGKAPLQLHERPGGALSHIIKILREHGYNISFNLYNTANYGAPQIRERVVIICSLNGSRLPYLSPTHSDDPAFGLPAWRNLKDAISDLNPREATYINFPEKRLVFYRLLKEGQYWKHLPESLQKQALGKAYYSGGGKTGFLRRLAWDRPSCTLVTHPAMPATDICHPDEDRPLSIQEYKRIQQFPDDWVICGSLIDQYRQIGNAVPIGLGQAIGKTILAHMKGEPIENPKFFPYSRYKNTSDISWETNMKNTQRKFEAVATKGADLFSAMA
ncbi:MAG: DNA cytosine methyltransferase [Candidatus Tokpelaia sp.]|nr:MAG: DNA cytosine methyltransferase [Candidatus Tokpelaia sp.]KAA6206203.1 MAG: DNA cytosine methyltransferase [Candidatus Tokpelaia sp.]